MSVQHSTGDFVEHILSQRRFILVTSFSAYDPQFRQDQCKFLSPGSVELQAWGPNPSTPVPPISFPSLNYFQQLHSLCSSRHPAPSSSRTCGLQNTCHQAESRCRRAEHISSGKHDSCPRFVCGLTRNPSQLRRVCLTTCGSRPSWVFVNTNSTRDASEDKNKYLLCQ